MTKEDKELLLKDLCARLPYGVEVKSSARKKSITLSLDVMVDFYLGYSVKPYLRPMSSMTDEEKKILHEKEYDGYMGDDVDYLNSIHVDYRDLVADGLALKALEGMYDFK